MKKNTNNRGFSLIELIMVAAIMVILSGMLAVVFSRYIEKSREAKDLTNVKNTVTEIQLLTSGRQIDNPDDYKKTVQLCQTQNGWTTDTDNLYLGGISITDPEWEGAPVARGTCTVYYKDGRVFINWGGSIDYSDSSNIIKFSLEDMQKQLDRDKNIYKKSSATTTTIVLPNGKSITTIVYTRNYDYFDNLNDRKHEETASAIYNRTSGKITHIVYYENGKLVNWKLVDGNWVEQK